MTVQGPAKKQQPDVMSHGGGVPKRGCLLRPLYVDRCSLLLRSRSPLLLVPLSPPPPRLLLPWSLPLLLLLLLLLAQGAQAHGFSEHFNAPLLSFPEKYYSQIESVDVVAAAVCSDAPFETRIVYKPQSDGGAGPAWDSTSLQRPASARKVDVPHMEWLILGDMVDYSFFQTS